MEKLPDVQMDDTKIQQRLGSNLTSCSHSEDIKQHINGKHSEDIKQHIDGKPKIYIDLFFEAAIQIVVIYQEL